MKLKDLLNDRTETLAKLSEGIGVSRQTLQNCLNGKGKPSLLTVKKICAYFGVDYKDYI